ncbi:lipocalin family protein [Flavobacterium sp.]|jgi:hypothetical protein|uniref:lipocalin family protein n=1 Tax=Flavobacterium sp. TaxID=239 RepID=UPI0037C198BF
MKYIKKLIYILSITFILLQSCSSRDDSNTPQLISDGLLVGKWNLISNTYGKIDNPIEDITTCQSAFWQFDFKNSKEIVFRATTDDPSTLLANCDPKLLNYTYTVTNDLLSITPVNSGYSGAAFFIKSLTITKLVLSSGKDEYNKYSIWTFKKQ